MLLNRTQEKELFLLQRLNLVMNKIGMGFTGFRMIGRVHVVASCEPEPSIADGLAVQRIISAAYTSAKSNQWVEVKS